MPRIKESQVAKRVQEITEMLKHLSAMDLAQQPQANLLVDIKSELRCLQAVLATADPTNLNFLEQWSSKKSTHQRFKNMNAIIHSLHANHQENSKSLKSNRWSFWETPKKIATANEHRQHVIDKFQKGANYSAEDRKFLGLAQLEESNTIKKLKKIKLAGEHLTYVTGEIAPPVGKMIKEGISATHASVVGGNVAASAGTGLSGIAMAVPIVGASVMAIMLMIEASKGALSARGLSDRAERITLVAVAIASIVLTALFIPYSPIIGAVVMAAGIYATYVKPYRDLKALEKELGQQLVDLQSREKEISEGCIDCVLNNNEKAALKQQLLTHYSQNDEVALESFQQAKELIDKGLARDLYQHPTIEACLGTQGMKDFLLQNGQSAQKELQTQISDVASKRKMKAAQSINGIFTIIGAALIPIPPLLFVGIAIVIVSSLVGVIITYQEPIGRALTSMKNKIEDFFKNLSNSEEKTVSVLDNDLSKENITSSGSSLLIKEKAKNEVREEVKKQERPITDLREEVTKEKSINLYKKLAEEALQFRSTKQTKKNEEEKNEGSEASPEQPSNAP